MAKMRITAYAYPYEKIFVDKWVGLNENTKIGVYDGTLRTSCDVVNPVITIADTDTKILKINYVNIREFNRFYFVTNIVSVRDGVWELSLHCDVLMSFSDHITNNVKGTITRNEYIQHPEIVDSNIQFDNDIRYSVLRFGNPKHKNGAEISFLDKSLQNDRYCYVLQTYANVLPN